MKLPIDQAEIEQKQKLLTQHRRNLSHLELQAARHGLDLPLAIHNALIAERDAIVALEKELAAWGVSLRPKPSWQALVIDPDSHWRKIIANHVIQLGGVVIERHAVVESEQEVIETSGLAIVGVPHPGEMPVMENGSTRQWIKNVVQLGHCLPLIVLASCKNRDTTLILRQALCQNGQTNSSSVTIFKENFDPGWFARVVHKILI
ncbi:MAG: hypothetical protein JW953_23665 [Anaerolineae bacterium]|nr:hypothetical protein [Anaerolineae bacterium]